MRRKLFIWGKDMRISKNRAIHVNLHLKKWCSVIVVSSTLQIKKNNFLPAERVLWPWHCRNTWQATSWFLGVTLPFAIDVHSNNTTWQQQLWEESFVKSAQLLIAFLVLFFQVKLEFWQIAFVKATNRKGREPGPQGGRQELPRLHLKKVYCRCERSDSEDDVRCGGANYRVTTTCTSFNHIYNQSALQWVCYLLRFFVI